MNGYCGDCDEQIEFVDSNIETECIDDVLHVYLVCPWCDEKELIAKVKIK